MPQELPEGTVTLLFTDVEGSTDMTSRRGDAAAREILRAHFELTREQVREHGGQEIKTMGDGFMVAFASARKAVACAVAIQRGMAEENRSRMPEDKVLVRMGLNTGEVIHEESDLFGSAVNAAARVASKAKGGQIMVADAVKAVIGTTADIKFVDRGRFRLKGFPERWHLYEVAWQPEAVPAMPSLAERTPFVFRETERAMLRGRLEQANGGHGGLILISGEPGVGKTRPAEELMAEARQLNMLPLLGRCYELEGAPPYIPFVEIIEAAVRVVPRDVLRTTLGEAAPEVARITPQLRRLFPDISAPLELPADQERRFLFNSVREFLERAGRAQPLLLVLDDLHWADDATFLLLNHIAQELAQTPVLVVGTYRDIDVNPASPLARGLESLLRQRLAYPIVLKPFDEAGVTALLVALSGKQPPRSLVGVVFKETDGNPFFVEEVFKHLAEEGKLFDAASHWREDLEIAETDVPETVRLVIGRRLERLSESSREVLTTAAIVGRTFNFDLVSALSEIGGDALLDAIDDAERAHLIVSVEGGAQARFSFAHELIRQTLLNSVSVARRQNVHLKAADVMEQVHSYVEQEHATDVAFHLQQAGSSADSRRTSHYLALAADRALAAAAFEDALPKYENALALLPTSDRSEKADLLFKRGLALRGVGRWDEALDDWRQTVSIYAGLRDTEAVGRTYAIVCQQLLWAPRLVEALELSQRGLAILGKRVSADRCMLLTAGGLALSLAGFYDAADRMMGQAISLAEQLENRALLGKVIGFRAVHHYCYAQLTEQLAAGLKATALLRSVGDLWDLADALWVTQIALVGLGRFEESERIGEELEPLAERLGHVGAQLVALRCRGLRELMTTGDLDEFETFAKKDMEICLSANLPAITQSHALLGLAAFWKGDWKSALEHFHRGADVPSAGVYVGLDWATLIKATGYAEPPGAAESMLRRTKAQSMAGIGLRRSLSLTLRLVMAARFSGFPLGTLFEVIRQMRLSKMSDYLPRKGRPNSLGSWVLLSAVIEGLIASDQRAAAGRLYPLMLEALKRSGSLVSVPDPRMFETTAGLAASAANRWPEAEQHFEAALRQADELPHRLEQPEARRFYAGMLIDRNAHGDRDKARLMLRDAIAMYRRIGMPKHQALAEASLARL